MGKVKGKTQRRSANRWQIDRRNSKRNLSERRSDSRNLFKHPIKQYAAIILVLSAFGFWLSDMMKEMGATSKVVQGTLRKGGPSTSFSSGRKLASASDEGTLKK